MRRSYTKRAARTFGIAFMATLFGVASQIGAASAAPSTWSLQPTENRGTMDALNAVSCTSSSFCMAVGSFDNSSGVSRTFGEMWNGNAWVKVRTKDVGDANNSLNGVSCTSPTDCIAAGFGAGEYMEGIVEKFNGSSWSIASILR